MNGPFFLAFTDRGESLARDLARALGGEAMRSGKPETLREWTKKRFVSGGALVFVGAVGIAVRAIAPYVDQKWKDPAVVAVDECGRFAIPLLSGHLGGANRLARAIAELCGATPVVTTATDLHGLFAVDDWARVQNLCVVEPERIRTVSAKVLAGGTLRLWSRFPIEGTAPAEVELLSAPPAGEESNAPAGKEPSAPAGEPAAPPDVFLSVHRENGESLHLAPRAVVLGVGCRRGISREAVEDAFAAFLGESGLLPQSVRAVASIDLKEDEEGLLAFCRAHGWPLETRSAQELNETPGDFTPSPFVRSVTGTDNVCERSAAAVSGGEILHRKRSLGGVTMAAALAPLHLTWSRD